MKQTQSFGVKGWRKFVLTELLTENASVISAAQAREELGKAIFLDTRSTAEYKISHIKNARFINYKKFSLSDVADLNKSDNLIVYCSIGKRSETVAKKMKKAGFTNVHNVFGGILQWVNQGFQIVNMQQEPTDSIHSYNLLWGLYLKKGIKVTK